MKFCCVTPCLNAEHLIIDTIESILLQSAFLSADNSLHYVIQDGGSTDGTLDVIRSIFEKYRGRDNFNLEVFSDPDGGMYDALSKGFKRLVDGDVYSYLNAGDYYSKFAVDIVWDIMRNGEAKFLTGFDVWYNQRGDLTNISLPFFYDEHLVRCGLYGDGLPWIQQESTFWSQEMHELIPLSDLSRFKLAGDYFIWRTFVDHSPLRIVSAYLGGFKYHIGQQSETSMTSYLSEMKEICDHPTFKCRAKAIVLKIIWVMTPDKLKMLLNQDIFFFDHLNGRYTNKNLEKARLKMKGRKPKSEFI